MHLRHLARIGPATLVFLASFAWLFGGVHVGRGGGDVPAFHLDEAHKLGEAYFYHLFFEQGDTGHPAWTGDFYARTNPPVAKYIFGAALAAAGRPVRDLQPQRDFETYWQASDRLRERVPDGTLRVTRTTSIVFGAAVCTLLFVIGRRAAGAAAGLIAAALLLGNPSFTTTARRGLTDTILLFHLALIVPVTLGAAGALQRQWQAPAAGRTVRRWCVLLALTVLLPGLVIALAAGSKLNGSLAGPSYAAGLFLTAVLSGGPRPLWRRLVLASAVTFLAAFTAVAVFVGLDPYYHHEPITRMRGSMAIWGDWMITQQLFPGPGLFTPRQRAAAVGYYSLRDPSLPLSRWLGPLHAGTLGRWLTVFGFAAGLVYLVGRCQARPRVRARDAPFDPRAEREPAPEGGSIVTLCWVLVGTAGITSSLMVLWDRHLLPAYLTISLTTAIGLAAIPRALRSIAEAIVGRSGGRAGVRIAAGSLATAGLWAVLAFTPWVIAPDLLPDPKAWSAVGVEGGSVQFHANSGVLLFRKGKQREAAEAFETALALLDRGGDDPSAAAVQRCRILMGLTLARAATGDRAGATEALRQYVAGLEQLRGAMRSSDPYVRNTYDLRIAEARRGVDELAGKPSE